MRFLFRNFAILSFGLMLPHCKARTHNDDANVAATQSASSLREVTDLSFSFHPFGETQPDVTAFLSVRPTETNSDLLVGFINLSSLNDTDRAKLKTLGFDPLQNCSVVVNIKRDVSKKETMSLNGCDSKIELVADGASASPTEYLNLVSLKFLGKDMTQNMHWGRKRIQFVRQLTSATFADKLAKLAREAFGKPNTDDGWMGVHPKEVEAAFLSVASKNKIAPELHVKLDDFLSKLARADKALSKDIQQNAFK